MAKITAIEPASAFRKHGLGSEEPDVHVDREERIGKAWRQLTAQYEREKREPSSGANKTEDRPNHLLSESSSRIDEDQDADCLLENGSSPMGLPVESKKGNSLLEQLKSEAVNLTGYPMSENQSNANPTSAKQSSSADRPPGMSIWSR